MGKWLAFLPYPYQDLKCCLLLFLTYLVPHVVYDEARLVAAHRVRQGVSIKQMDVKNARPDHGSVDW